MKRNILFQITFLLIICIISSCGTIKHKDITGEEEIKEVFNKNKYQDTEDVMYVFATGEHGDESTARNITLNDARLRFNLKAAAIVETAMKKNVSQSLRNRVGTMSIEAMETVISKAAQGYMLEEEGKLFYTQDRGTYIYRAVYKLDIEKVISVLADY